METAERTERAKLLYDKTHASVRYEVRRRGLLPGMSEEDIVHEVFARAIKMIHKWRYDELAVPYIRKILKNYYADVLRRNRLPIAPKSCDDLPEADAASFAKEDLSAVRRHVDGRLEEYLDAYVICQGDPKLIEQMMGISSNYRHQLHHRLCERFAEDLGLSRFRLGRYLNGESDEHIDSLDEELRQYHDELCADLRYIRRQMYIVKKWRDPRSHQLLQTFRGLELDSFRVMRRIEIFLTERKVIKLTDKEEEEIAVLKYFAKRVGAGFLRKAATS